MFTKKMCSTAFSFIGLSRLEEEWEHRNRERLITTVLHANRKVQEANLLAEALHKDTVFKVTLTVSYIGDSSPFSNQLNISCFTWRERGGLLKGFTLAFPLSPL